MNDVRAVLIFLRITEKESRHNWFSYTNSTANRHKQHEEQHQQSKLAWMQHL